MSSALEIELGNWHNNLPPHISFDPNINVDTLPAYGPLARLVDDNVAWIRSSYVACRVILYWHAALGAAMATSSVDLGQEYRLGVEKHLLGFMRYTASAKQYLFDRFHPLVWSQSQKYVSLYELEG